MAKSNNRIALNAVYHGTWRGWIISPSSMNKTLDAVRGTLYDNPAIQ